jgi:four helix bundle protein
MRGKQNFENLNAWKKARELCLCCYKLVKRFPAEERFGLSGQLKRAAVSIPLNIAEGYSRKSVKDSSHFFNIAMGSIYEVITQVDIATELGYIDLKDKEELLVMCNESLKLINGFLNFKKNNE